MVVMTGKELAEKCIDVAKNYKTLYVMGCFGAAMKASHKPRYLSSYKYNREPDRTKAIDAADENTFGFDCVCLIKGILWGWNGDTSHVYGGAKYNTNGVPDIGANSMIKVCSNISTDFSKIEVGEAVWMEGHIGIYVGDGLAVECTPIWKDGVQLTAVGNIGKKSGYNTRTWTKHGKLPYVSYAKEGVGSSCITYNVRLTQKLKQGSSGEEVKKLQMRVAQISPSLEKEVKSHSMNENGEPDGIFGAAMKKTMMSVQSAAGLTATGELDDATIALLNASVLTLNSKIVGALKALK